jgi:branched-chain amino acid transport system substrate-binding protein
VFTRISLIFLLFLSVTSSAKTLKIYIDADFSHHRNSALAIEAGIKTALSQHNFQLQGYQFELVRKDHRGNTSRSLANLKAFLNDPDALVLFAGLHSPPLIKNQTFINENKLLTLVPWAAAGPITRPKTFDNWVFRLSIDDTQAGFVIAEFATGKKGCKQPHLLLEKTPWGESNFKTMSAALGNESYPYVTWYNWGTQENKMATLLRNIKLQQSDCILFVGNAIEGHYLVKAMLESKDLQLPIYSHWGITGGNFHLQFEHADLEKVQLYFIQPCFSFLNSKTELAKRVTKQYQTIASTELPKAIQELSAPAGFIHSYDLTNLLINAINKIRLTDNLSANRIAIKESLESLTETHEGLLKRYQQPFNSYTQIGSAQHEALTRADYCMGRYNNLNQVELYQQ